MKIEGTKHKVFFALIILTPVFFVFTQSIITIGSNDNIWIEAENSINDLTGFSIIETPEASGNKAIVSEALSHNIENYGEYNFFVNSTSIYYLWGRFYGDNACGNSFYVSVDNSNRFLIGNDDLLRQWHWLRGPEVTLNPGKHKLFILNEEHGTKIDRILLTTDPVFVPSGKGESSDFDISFNKNYSNIIAFKDASKWGIKTFNTIKSLYLKKCSKEINYFNIKSKTPQFYCFKSEFYFDPKRELSLILIYNYLNDNNYRYIEIGNNVINQYEKIDNNLHLISSSTYNIEQLLIKNESNNISLIIDERLQYLMLNGYKIKEIKNFGNKGHIGLGSKTGNVFFTNLLLNSNIKPSVNITFFNGLSGKWNIIDGKWTLLKEPVFNLFGMQNNSNPAIISYGEEYWRNYSLSATIHFNSDTSTAVGIIFNMQNEGNYYLFKCESQNNSDGNIKLIKVKDKIPIVLCAKNGEFDDRQFYKFEAKLMDGKINTYIDDELIFSHIDTSFLSGKIGLFSSGNEQKNMFDDLIVQPSGVKEDSLIFLDYSFYNRLGISKDLSDWENSYDFISFESGKVFKTKKLFESQIIYNKKIFTDELIFDLNTSVIPPDVDLSVHLKSILSDNNFEVMFKYDKLILKINNEIEKYDFNKSQQNALKISYRDKSQKLIVAIDSVNIVEKLTKIHLKEYKVGLEFKGIGNWDIVMPRITIKANKCFNKKYN